MKGKEIYYVVIPTISEFNPKSEVLTLWRNKLTIEKISYATGFSYCEVEHIINEHYQSVNRKLLKV
jgi:hypothetical protein